jgi:hypothetical protein
MKRMLHGSGTGPQNTTNTAFMAAEKPNLPHPDAVTNNQIEGLLRVHAAMTSALAYVRPGGDATLEPALSGESKAAVEVVLWRVCDQLERIVTDPNRWNTTFQKGLELRAESLFKQQQEFLAAQIAASQEVSKPHFKYRPEMKKLQGGGWICFVGDIEKPEEGNCIIGVGQTPAEAVEAFDEQFHGRITPYMKKWLAEREQESNQNEQQQSKVDPGTDEQTGSPS